MGIDPNAIVAFGCNVEIEPNDELFDDDYEPAGKLAELCGDTIILQRSHDEAYFLIIKETRQPFSWGADLLDVQRMSNVPDDILLHWETLLRKAVDYAIIPSGYKIPRDGIKYGWMVICELDY